MKALLTTSRIDAYFAQRVHWLNVLFVLLGGYAIGSFVWQFPHRQELVSYIFDNRTSSGSYPNVFLLLGAALLACLLWLTFSASVARRTGKPLEAILDRVSGGFLALVPLSILPVLFTTGVEHEHTVLTLALIAAVGVIAAAAAYTVQGQTSERSAARTPASHPRLSARHARLGGGIVALLTLGYVLFMSTATLLRHKNLLTFAFDLGIQDQVIYNIVHSGRMTTTLLGASERLYDHFSPLFYVLAPIYALFPHASTLLILQSLALGAGAIAVYLLAREKAAGTPLAVALAASYLLHPALHGVNIRDFHQIAFATSLLLFSLYFLERRRDLAFLIALFLALLAKEEIALSVAAIGLYVLLVKRRSRLGIPVTLFGLAYFIVTTVWLLPWLGTIGPAESRYADFLIPGMGLFQSLLRTVIANPLYPITYVLADQGKNVYLLQLLLPVFFLPLLAPLAAWVLALPALLLTLLVAPNVDYGIGFHYPAHVIPFIFFLAVLALQRLKLNARRGAALAASILAVSLTMSIVYGQIITKQGILLPQSSQHTVVVQEFLSSIPADASISTMNQSRAAPVQSQTDLSFPHHRGCRIDPLRQQP